MSLPIAFRPDFDAAALRKAAKATKDAAQSRRLLALAEIYDGGTRTDAARIGGVGLQTVRDWVLAFNADGPAGLVDGKAPGNPSKLNDVRTQALAHHQPGTAGVSTPVLINARWYYFSKITRDEMQRECINSLCYAMERSYFVIIGL